MILQLKYIFIYVLLFRILIFRKIEQLKLRDYDNVLS